MINMDSISKKDKLKIDLFSNILKSDAIKRLEIVNIEERENVFKLECFNAYQRIIKRYAMALKEISIDNPFYVSKLFEILLWNGYFSKDKKFAFDRKNKINMIHFYGADVMKGSSVCINNSFMLKDVFSELEIENYSLCVRIIQENVTNSFSLYKRIFEFLRLDSLLANHMINLFSSDGRFYEIDITNSLFFVFSDFLRMKSVHERRLFLLKINTLSTCLLDIFDREKFSEAIVRSFLCIDEETFGVAQVEEIANTSFEIYDKYAKLFDDMYLKSISDIDSVCNTLKLFSGR